jgi:phenylacetic acid degradation operon negative regulatory protein
MQGRVERNEEAYVLRDFMGQPAKPAPQERLFDMSGPMPPALSALAARFLARKPPRIWSLLVTVFGVEALPTRTSIRLSDLQNWLSVIGIEAGLVRTALSRLVANGTLLRERDGKAALYRLSAPVEEEFRTAGERIFGDVVVEPTGHLELVWIEENTGRNDMRAVLEEQGFVPLASNLMVRPHHAGRLMPVQPGGTGFLTDIPAGFAARAGLLWPLAELAEGYRETIRWADSVAESIATFSERDTFLARLLLVHEFRRVILRDPCLPSSMLPADWPGSESRRAFNAAMKATSDRQKV